MRDAPRHVRPGGTALRRHQIGDVVERDDQALDLAAGALLRDLDVEGAQLAAARSAGSAQRAGPRLRCRASSSTVASAGIASSSGRPTRSLSARPSASSADRLTRVTRAVAVEAYDAGRNARQHRLGEAPALVDLLVGRRAARSRCELQLARHGVEGGGERADVAGRSRAPARARRDCRPKPPAPRRSAVGSARRGSRAKPSPIQIADSSTTSATPTKTIAKATCTPNRFACSCWYSAAFSSVSRRYPRDPRIDRAREVEVDVVEAGELDDAADEVGRAGRDQRRLAAVELRRRSPRAAAAPRCWWSSRPATITLRSRRMSWIAESPRSFGLVGEVGGDGRGSWHRCPA